MGSYRSKLQEYEQEHPVLSVLLAVGEPEITYFNERIVKKAIEEHGVDSCIVPFDNQRSFVNWFGILFVAGFISCNIIGIQIGFIFQFAIACLCMLIHLAVMIKAYTLPSVKGNVGRAVKRFYFMLISGILVWSFVVNKTANTYVEYNDFCTTYEKVDSQVLRYTYINYIKNAMLEMKKKKFDEDVVDICNSVLKEKTNI